MKIHTKELGYTDGPNRFKGSISWDSDSNKKRPGVLIFHNWVGQGDFEINKAEALAALGYVGFAVDLYGEGKRAANDTQASVFMHELTDHRSLLLQRVQHALSVFRQNEWVDKNNIAAIGFCFGGKCVLDLARSGEDIKGVVSFHGVYDPPNIQHDKKIHCSVLVHHGWNDPMASPEQTVALANELTALKADWRITAYGHTGHAFTNPNANAPEDGMYFQAASNERSWRDTLGFFEEIFRVK